MKSVRARITSAHVIAMIALFVALGGTVYAAGGFNGKLIRKESIPGNRVAKNGLTGDQINEGSLGTVPSATLATEATRAKTANSATSAETATSATNATHATTAVNATNAVNANKAIEAVNATNATNATNLGGKPGSSYQQACSAGAVKGSVVIDPAQLSLQFGAVTGFNCDGLGIEARRAGTGVFEVRFQGGAGLAGTGLASTSGALSAQVQTLGGPGVVEKIFQIKTLDFNTNQVQMVPSEPQLLTLTVF